jgi:hypothetical protein
MNPRPSGIKSGLLPNELFKSAFITDKSFNEFYPFSWCMFLNPLKSVILLSTKKGKIAQELRILPMLDIFGQFYPF